MLSSSLKELEKRIKDELKNLGFSIYFRIDNFNSEKRALEHTISYHDIISNRDALKINEVIEKYYIDWLVNYLTESKA